MRTLEAAIFDMDGLLIDSEPFWRRAQVRVLGGLGVPLTISDTEKTMGVRIGEVVAYWLDRYPWSGPSKEEVANAIVDHVISLVESEGRRLDGVEGALDFFHSRGIPVGLATSSDERLIEAILAKLDLEDAFMVTCSAAHEEFGKPHPAVFLTAAAELGVEPEGCLVFEDSVSGVEAGKAAGMTVIAVPGDAQFDNDRFGLADLKLRSLLEFGPETIERLYG